MENNLGLLLSAFIIIIVGIVLINSIADTISAATTLSSVVNESIAITTTTYTAINETITISSGTGTVNNGSVISITFFGNATHSTDGSSAVTVAIGTNVNHTKAGVITLNGTFNNGDYNISYTHTKKGTGTTAQDDLTSLIFFGNASNSTHLASITLGNDINFTREGVISVNTYPFDAGTYNISYKYESDDYLADSTSRTLIGLVVLFFALAILGVGYLIVIKAYNNMNF